MAAWGYEISLRLLKKKLKLEEKFLIPARPCNILYIQGRKFNNNKIFTVLKEYYLNEISFAFFKIVIPNNKRKSLDKVGNLF